MADDMNDRWESSKIKAPEGLWRKIEARVDEWEATRAAERFPVTDLVTGRPALRMLRLPRGLRTGAWAPGAKWAGVAAAVTLAFWVGWQFSLTEPQNDLVKLVIEDHVSYVDSANPPDFRTADLGGLQSWFMRRKSGPMDLPVTDHAGLKLAGGRICQLKDKTFYVVLYGEGTDRRAYYITRNDRGGGHPFTAASVDRKYRTGDGIRYAGWVQNDYMYMRVDYQDYRL